MFHHFALNHHFAFKAKFLFYKEELHPNQKLACFVLFLKFINTFLKNNVCIL